MKQKKTYMLWFVGGFLMAGMLWLRMPILRTAVFPASGLLGPGTVFAGEEDASAADAEKRDENGETGADAPPPEPTQEEKEAAAAEEVKLVLSGLEEKKIFLQKEAARIQAEAARLTTLREELETRIETLKELQQQIDQSLAALEQKETDKEKKRRVAEERKIAQLVKVYASMKPKAAGAIVDNMDLDVAMKLFSKLKGEKAGLILSYVNSEKAAQITERLLLSGQELNVPPAATE
ncbi:MAG: hypothetical protein CSA22_02965 [Deltaproteobacteria bacterium]|nr:MAG: hypothetical protein CSA22_02965 [Deltaproteobacteria bacterium]